MAGRSSCCEINVTNSDGVIDVEAWLEEYREK